MSANVILFQGNQKNIRVGLSGRNNVDFWFVYKKFRVISGLSGRLKAQFLVMHGCFPKRPIFFIPNLSRFEKICFRPYSREVWEVRFKALFVSCVFILRVAEAPADHESTNEDFRGCSRDDKPVFISSGNQQVRPKYLKP